jgi:hypothetical protein
MGDRVQIINPPSWLGGDTIDQLILGVEEQITHFEHRLTFTCAPASPYNTIGYLDTTTARIDTDGSQLATDLTSTATSVPVATTSGPGWVQSGQLNTNRGFETDLANWTGSGATLARVATPGLPPFGGSWSMQITPDGVAQFPNAGSEQIAVTAGLQYVLSGWLLCATSRNVDLNVNWFDGTHAYLSTTANDQQVAANTWSFFQQTVTPPAGAVYANLSPTVPSFPPSSNVLYADEIVFRLASDTTNDDFPFDIRVGGEVMRAGAITPAVLDTFTRSVANGWGTADTGQVWSTTGGAAADYAVTSATSSHICNSVNTLRYTVLPIATEDADITVEWTMSANPSGDSQYVFVFARYTDTNHFYFVRVEVTTANAMILTVRKRNGSETQLGSAVTTQFTHAAGTWYKMRFRTEGATLKAKLWTLGTSEPGTWDITTTDGDLVGVGSVGVRTLLGSASTAVLPVTIQFDNFTEQCQQTFTVIRSVNGVVKAHSAGEDVRLANPTILAL